ncbi:hypothetical protein [Chitinophaga polysaccharea]|uniref:hypothetical protein n=1 Tax=Chitinophaga polysaccharea TaxID=1293035 RepID=UPI00115852C9|nr:hypothetical protein [Chitinophaga polysaccharea]
MKLIELIDHLKTASKAEQLRNQQIPDVEYDLVELYMKDSLSFESEIAFFDAETIPGYIIIEMDGIRYKNLFSLNLIQEMVEEYVAEYPNWSDLDIAKRIMEYRINDA